MSLMAGKVTSIRTSTSRVSSVRSSSFKPETVSRVQRAQVSRGKEIFRVKPKVKQPTVYEQQASQYTSEQQSQSLKLKFNEAVHNLPKASGDSVKDAVALKYWM